MDGESTILETEAEETSEDNTETEAPKEEKLESAEESAWKAYEELQKKGGDGEESEEEKEDTPDPAPSVEPKQEKQAKEPGKQAKEEEPQEPELNAPERLNESEKKLFNQLPKRARRVFHRLVKDMEGRTHKGLQNERAEYNNYNRRYRDLEAIVEPHRGRLAKINHTPESAIAEFLDMHFKLADRTNWRKEAGRLINQLEQAHGEKYFQEGGASSSLDSEIEASPVYQTLRQQNDLLRQELDSVKQAIEAPRVQAIQQTNEDLTRRLVAFAQQVDNEGRLVNPKLTQDPNYFDTRIRPLVVGLMHTDPEVSFEQALTEACNRVEKRNGYMHSQIPAKQPAPKSNINNLSMRGKSVSLAGGLSEMRGPVNPHESAEETAWREYNRLIRG